MFFTVNFFVVGLYAPFKTWWSNITYLLPFAATQIQAMVLLSVLVSDSANSSTVTRTRLFYSLLALSLTSATILLIVHVLRRKGVLQPITHLLSPKAKSGGTYVTKLDDNNHGGGGETGAPGMAETGGSGGAGDPVAASRRSSDPLFVTRRPSPKPSQTIDTPQAITAPGSAAGPISSPSAVELQPRPSQPPAVVTLDSNLAVTTMDQPNTTAVPGPTSGAAAALPSEIGGTTSDVAVTITAAAGPVTAKAAHHSTHLSA